MEKPWGWFGRSRIILAIFIVASVAVIAIGFSYYLKQKQEFQNKIEDELKSIAELKSDQISQWYKERLSEAIYFSTEKEVIEKVSQQLLGSNQNKALNNLLIHILSNQRYENIFIVSKEGFLIFSIDSSFKKITPKDVYFSKLAASKNEIVFSDLYLESATHSVRLDYIAPIKNDSNQTIATLVFRIDPDAFLFPLIQNWPTKSKTAETVIVRRDGDSATFVNDVRHRIDAALKIKFPLTRLDVPAVRAALGTYGIFEGNDYRGVRVLTYSKAIQNTPWIMISKVDVSEIYQPIRFQGRVYGIAAIVLIILLILLFYLIRGADQSRYYKRLFELEVERKILKSHFEYLVKNANDIIILANERGEIIEANQSALNAYQLSEKELKKLRLSELGDFNIISGKKSKNQILPDKPYEAIHKRKKGDRFPVEISGKFIEIDGIRYYQAIVRDISERKKNENELAERETQYRNLANSGSALIWTSGVDKKCTYFNEPWLDFTGRALEQELGDGWAEGVYPDDLPDCFKTYVEAFDAHKSFEMEYRLRNASGEYRWIRDMGTPNYNSKGEFVGYIGHCFDITEHKNFENKLQENENRLSLIFNLSPVGIVITRPEDGFILDSNKAYSQIFGYEPHEIIGKSTIDLNLWVDLPDRDQINKTVEENGLIKNFETRVRKKDGEIRYIEGNVEHIVIKGKTYNLSLVNDITEQKLAREKLRESEERLSLVMEGSQLGYWDWFIETGEVYRNTRWAEMLGYTLEEIQQSVKQWTDLHHPEDKEAAMKSIQDHLEGKTPTHRIEYRMRTKNGQYKWILDQAKVVEHDVNGKPLRMSGTHTDITERKQAEIAIKESERRFASLFRSNPTPIGITSASGYRIFDVNDAWCKLTSYSREEAIGHDSTELGLAKPQTLELVNAMLQAHGEMPQTEIQLYTRSGEERHVLISAETIVIGGEKYVLNNLIDFTERKNFEQKIQESETKFRSFFENSMDAIIFSSPEGQIFSANPAACKMYGYTEKEICSLGRNGLVDTSDPHLLELIKERDEKGYASGELTMIRKDGTHFPVEITSSIFDMGNGNIRTNLVIRDVTEKKITQEMLRKSEARFRGVYENASIGLYRTTPDGTILMANPAIIKMLGYNSFEEVSSINLEDTEHYSQDRIRKEFKERVEKEGEIIGYESIWIRKDGTSFYGRENAKSVRDKSGKILYYEGSVEDITEFKLEEKARKEREALFFATFHSSPIPVSITNPDSDRWIEVNEAFLEVTGYNRDEIIGNTYRDINLWKHLEDREKMKKMLINEGHVRNFEVDINKKNGRTATMLISVEKIILSGEPILLIMGNEITERKLANDVLKESEQRYRSLFENMLNGFAYCQMYFEDGRPSDFRYLSVNKNFEVLTGLKNVEGKLVSEAIPGIRETDPGLFEMYGGVATTGKPVFFETYVESLNDWYSISVYSPKQEYFVAVFDVITNRKRSELELKKSEERYRTFFENNNAIMLQLDPNTGNIVDVNFAATKFYGWTHDELCKMRIYDINTLSKNEIDDRMQLSQKQKKERFEFKHRLKSGELRDVAVYSSHVVFNEKTYLFSIIFDITEQKDASEKLHQSEDRFRKVNEQSQTVIWEIDTNGLYTHVSPTAAKVWGYSPVDLIGKMHYYDIHPAEGREEFKKITLEVISRQEKFFNLVNPIVNPTGDVIWVMTNGTPVYNSNNEFIGYIGSDNDITSEKTAQEALQSSNENNRLLFDHNPIPMWVYDLETLKFLRVNEVAIQKYGYTAEEFLSMTLKDIRPEEDVSLLLTNVQESSNKTIQQSGAWRHKLKNGKIILVEIHSHSLEYEGIAARLVAAYDITERKQIEATIKLSEARYRSLVETQADVISRSDVYGNLSFVNESYCRTFGIDFDQINSKNFKPTIVPEDIPIMIEVMEAIKKPPYRKYVEIRNITEKGIRWFGWDNSAVLDENGNVFEFQGVGRDITEQKNAEEYLKKSEERFRSTLDNMIEGCQIIGYDWRYIYVNLAAEIQNQRPKDELIGNEYTEMCPGVENTIVYKRMKICMEERIPQTFENEFVFANGNTGWYDLSIQPIPEGIFILSVDITEEKLAQKEANLKDELLHLTGTMAKVGGWEFDVDTMKGTWTDEVAIIHDLDPSQETNVELGISFYADDSKQKIENAIGEAIKNATPYDLELEMNTAKGAHKWVRTMGIPLKNEKGVYKVRGIFQDITEQIKANERLRQSEDRFRTLVESAPEAIFIQTESKFSYINPAAVKLFKAESIYDLLGKPVINYFHPNVRDQVKQRMRSLNNLKNAVPNVEERCIAITGEEFDVEVSAVPFNYELNDGALFFLHDITERKKAEQNLKRSEEQFIRAFHANPIGLQISTIDDGKIIEANEAYCKIYGFKKEELWGRTVLELGLYQNPDDRKPIVELLKKQGYVREVEVNFKTKTGELRILLGSLEPIIFNDQKCLISFVIDITERKAVENEIKRINAELEIRVEERTAEVFDLYNNAPCGYHSLDSNGVFLFINDTELNWFGYKREEVIGKLKAVDLMTGESKLIFAENFSRYKENGILNDLEITFIRNDGSLIPTLMSATAIYDENHNFIMSRTTLIDNTNLKLAKDEIIKAKENLEVANNELEAFSYTVSHDLRAPLRAIHGFIQILEEDYVKALDDEGLRVMQVIQENTLRMAQLIDDLLAFSRITRTEIRHTTIDTEALAASIYNELTENIEKGKIKFELKKLPRIQGDNNLISQVWKNLIGNAIKYSSKKEKPEIEIGFVEKAEEYEFYIKDNGAGFDMAYYDKLFGVFQRLHGVKEFEGTGVGLAIVQRIISRHGGKVWAIGEVNKGATFYFTIPK